jgi:carboxymethylenebutenolidase
MAEMATPTTTTPAPAVIVIHEYWGLNDDMRELVARLADDGFVAIAPDLYHGEVTADPSRARALADALDTGTALRDISSVVQLLDADPRAGAVGITGFCLGGAVALAAAGHVDGLRAAAPFYGIPRPQWLEAPRESVPVQGHYGARDTSIPVERPRAVFQALAVAGVDVELHLYDAGHAFVRRNDASYDEVAATAAWSRMVAFFRRHLAP